MKTIYRADDGKEFDDRDLCEAYERAAQLMQLVPGYQMAQRWAALACMPFAFMGQVSNKF